MSVTSNMPSSSNLILGLAGEIVKKVSGKATKDAIQTLLGAFFVALLFAIATAPSKIILRKNFGQNAISTAEIIFGALFMTLWSYVAIAILVGSRKEGWAFDNMYLSYLTNLYVLGLIFATFLLMALAVIGRGFAEEKRTRFIESNDWKTLNFRGESLLYASKIKNDKMLYKTWRVHEPNFCFRISCFALLVHPLLGVPLLITSTAFWANEYYHVKYKWEKFFLLSETSTSTVESFGSGNVVGS